MKKLLFWMILPLLLAACASKSGSEQAVAYCERVHEIRSLPFRGEKVDDAVYNGLRDLGEKAVPCLIEQVASTKSIPDPRKAPPYEGITVGDVALFVLFDIKGLSFGDVLPDDVEAKMKEQGVYAYFAYVEDPRNRKAIQERLRASK
jgi:hypothetical protein